MTFNIGSFPDTHIHVHYTLAVRDLEGTQMFEQLKDFNPIILVFLKLIFMPVLSQNEDTRGI